MQMKFKNKALGKKKTYGTKFVLLLLSVLVSTAGTQMTDFALGIWIYESTKSALITEMTSVLTSLI